jgi:hypothetical protein
MVAHWVLIGACQLRHPPKFGVLGLLEYWDFGVLGLWVPGFNRATVIRVVLAFCNRRQLHSENRCERPRWWTLLGWRLGGVSQRGCGQVYVFWSGVGVGVDHRGLGGQRHVGRAWNLVVAMPSPLFCTVFIFICDPF